MGLIQRQPRPDETGKILGKIQFFMQLKRDKEQFAFAQWKASQELAQQAEAGVLRRQEYELSVQRSLQQTPEYQAAIEHSVNMQKQADTATDPMIQADLRAKALELKTNTDKYARQVYENGPVMINSKREPGVFGRISPDTVTTPPGATGIGANMAAAVEGLQSRTGQIGVAPRTLVMDTRKQVAAEADTEARQQLAERKQVSAEQTTQENQDFQLGKVAPSEFQVQKEELDAYTADANAARKELDWLTPTDKAYEPTKQRVQDALDKRNALLETMKSGARKPVAAPAAPKPTTPPNDLVRFMAKDPARAERFLANPTARATAKSQLESYAGTQVDDAAFDAALKYIAAGGQ